MATTLEENPAVERHFGPGCDHSGLSCQAPPSDNWKNLSTLACETCYVYVSKDGNIGRCRRHAPTISGYPVVYANDWCGDHKIGRRDKPYA